VQSTLIPGGQLGSWRASTAPVTAPATMTVTSQRYHSHLPLPLPLPLTLPLPQPLATATCHSHCPCPCHCHCARIGPTPTLRQSQAALLPTWSTPSGCLMHSVQSDSQTVAPYAHEIRATSSEPATRTNSQTVLSLQHLLPYSEVLT
jgi:hypothetical protein